MRIRLLALAIVLSLVVLGMENTSYAKGKTTKKAQTTHVMKKSTNMKTTDMNKKSTTMKTANANKKSTNMKTADMNKKETSAIKSKKEVTSANHHKIHKMTKSSNTLKKSHKATTKTSKTSTKPNIQTPKSAK